MRVITETEKLLAEERKLKMLEQVRRLNATGVESEFVTKLAEDITNADWTRFGVVFGLLWSKLDSLISAIKEGNRNGDDIKRVLGDISKTLSKSTTTKGT